MPGTAAYEQGMETLLQLPDQAEITLLPAVPAFDQASGEALVGAIGKLFSHFAREGRVSRWGAEILGGGHVLAIAWLGEQALSGCSRDTLTRLLAAHELETGRQIIAAPPIVVEVAGQPRCMDRRTLRTLCEQGEVTPLCIHWNLRVSTLAAWRSAGRRPAQETWLAALIPQPRPLPSAP